VSDVFEGPGWWMASDAKWYAPQLHPDSEYRRRWSAEAAPEPEPAGRQAEAAAATVTVAAATTVVEEPSPPPVPVAALGRKMPSPVVKPYDGTTHRVVDLFESRTIDLTEPDPDITEPDAAEPIEIADANAGAVFEPATDPSPDDVQIIEEVDDIEIVEALVTPRAPVEQVSVAPPSTALVHVASESPVFDEPVARWDRIVASTLFLAGITMIVGTFLPWSVAASRDLSGWEMGDGIATVFAGVLGSAAAGPIYVGFRHMIPKTIALISGLVGFVVTGLAALRVVSDDVLNGTTVGLGIWVVLAGAVAMMVAALADRSTIVD